MQPTRRDFLKLTGSAVALAGTAALAWPEPAQAQAAAAQLGDETLHFLNRISWGARPEDVERAHAIGIGAYLEEQLNPATLDDSATDALLASHVILNMKRQEAYRLANREYRTSVALIEGMLLRAVHSKRQLHERMVEFWLDHFNIAVDELGPDLVVYQREVVRQHALGSFRDLLMGTAQNPAMLYYLDNFLNVAEHPNENYARELMELHTLGVDGGYTEDDVKAVARAFTGWTVNDATESGFWFDETVHDVNEKMVLGHRLPSSRGIEDGLHVLSILANHPSTARFVCRKLCVRFVSDNPPASLVESAAVKWMTNGGELKSVLTHIFTSEEFRQSAGQKLRRPLDFFVGALRATGTESPEFWRTEEMLQALAQVPYRWQPPNGYPDVAGAWMSSGGLLARWNVAMQLTHGALSDPEAYMTSHLMERTGQPATVGEMVDSAGWQVFAAPLPPAERAVFIDYAADGAGEQAPVTPHLLSRKLGTLYGLMLAAPLYQWR